MSLEKKQYKDGRYTTMNVSGQTTCDDLVVDGTLYINGDVQGIIPDTINTGNIPFITSWNPFQVTSFICNSTAELGPTMIESLTLDTPNVVSGSTSTNTYEVYAATTLPTTHSIAHFIEKNAVSGTTTPVHATKSSVSRNTQCNQDTIALDANASFSGIDGVALNKLFVASRSTVTNNVGTNKMQGSTIASYNKIENQSTGGITDARAGYFWINNNYAGGSESIQTGIGVHARLQNNLASSTFTNAKGIYVDLVNNATGKMLNVEGATIQYQNLNGTVPNTNYVWGINLGGGSTPWSASTGISSSRGINIDSSTAVGTDYWSIYCENGAGSIRSSGRKKRYRIISAIGPDTTITKDDEILYVQSPVTGVTLPALPTVAGLSTDESTIQIRNLSSSNVTVNASAIQAIGTSSTTTSVVLLPQTAGTFQATTLGSWIAVQLASTSTITGNKQNYRIVTAAVVTQESTDSIMYMDSNTVTQYNLLALPTLALSGIDRNILELVNEGPNDISIVADGADLVKPTGGGASVASVLLPAYTTLKLQATINDWRTLSS